MESAQLVAHLGAQLQGDERVLVAYSGGLDSTVLLHALVTLRQTRMPGLILRAVYIHHGLSANADHWSEHCHRCCQQWQVTMQTEYVHLHSQGKGVEAAAREARYQVLRQQLQTDEVLMTAQHLDDQCETVLLALKRGSGPAGLAAMPDTMPFARGKLRRPLLALSRTQLEHYARQVNLSWIEDESNQDQGYDRNFLRHAIVPSLVQRWPHFARAVARSAALCGEQEQLLDELLADNLAQLSDDDNSLCIEGLQHCSPAKRNALLRRWIARAGTQMPSRDQLNHLWSQVALSQQDALPCLWLAKWQVRRFRQRLYLLPPLADVSGEVLCWDGRSPLLLPDHLGSLVQGSGSIIVRPPGAEERVTIRFATGGRVRLAGRPHSRPLKKVWQELNVAPWLRQRTPLLFFNEQLIAALGCFVTAEGDVGEGAIWRIEWLKG
ncbi:MAG: tRNA lysidine(34) synthetase TilS [Enterobacteriaceae bacterium]